MADDIVLKVEGLEELQKALQKFPQEWKRTTSEALGPGLALLESGSKKEAPVDTGALRASIGSEIVRGSGSEIIGKVGSSLEYAPYQEYGTRFQPGKPFLRPTLARYKDKVVKMFEEGISKALKRLLG